MARFEDCGINVEQALPQEATFRDRGGSGLGAIIFGVLFVGFAGLVGYGVGRELPAGWLAGLPFAAFGLLAVLHGLQTRTKSRHVRLTAGQVEVLDKGLLGSHAWSEAVGNYDGVLTDVEYYSENSGNQSRSYPVYTVKLKHADPKRTVTLHESFKEEGHRKRWEAMARLLKLKALEKVGDELAERDLTDLDKNVAKLIEEGKITVDQEVLQQTPKGFRVSRGKQGVRITWARTFPIMIAAFGGGFTGIPAYVAYFTSRPPEPLKIVVPILGTLFVFITVVVWLTRSRLTISRTSVIYEEEILGKRVFHQELLVEALESVRIDKLPNSNTTGIVFRGDGITDQICDDVSKKKREWLLAMILATLSEK